ncbi:hypothetical protein [Polynucleobacter tropicus]|nr:hypothetical protein [Polynucleobacter tropicus]
MGDNIVFQKITSEILAVSSRASLNGPPLGQQLYESFVSTLHKEFKELKEIESKFVKVFYKNKRNILSIEIQANAIKVTINAKIGSLKDDKKLLRDVSNIGHWGNGDYQIRLQNKTLFKDVLKLVKQIY